MELTGKKALVTGATGGIGGEAAKLLAQAGAHVVVTGRDPERGAALVKTITEQGGTARFQAADLTDPDSLRSLVEAAGEVDILVNNAAVFPMGPTISPETALDGEAFDTTSFDAVFATNVRAPYLLTAAFAPGMIARGSGTIVNVSSMAARIGMAGLPVYSASKAAIESLTRTWAAELSPSGVRVNAVAPGPTRTDIRSWPSWANRASRRSAPPPRSAASPPPGRSPRSSTSSPATAPPTSPARPFPRTAVVPPSDAAEVVSAAPACSVPAW